MTRFAGQIRIYPAMDIRRSLADAIAWGNRPKIPKKTAQQRALERLCELHTFPVRWDATSLDRNILQVITPFQSAGAAVEKVVAERRAFINEYTDLDRLITGSEMMVVYEPSLSLSDGLAQLHSNNFFDVNDCPPCSTWLCYIVNMNDLEINIGDPSKGGLEIDYLISYVPESFIKAATAGIRSNATSSLRWFDNNIRHSKGPLNQIYNELRG